MVNIHDNICIYMKLLIFLDKYCNYCLRQIKYSFISLVNVRFAFKNYLGT